MELRVHVDERGEEQREALAAILTGRLGGDDILRLPWVRKPSNELAVRPSAIELRHGPDGHELRVGSSVELSATQPVETDERVTCGIPGYHIAEHTFREPSSVPDLDWDVYRYESELNKAVPVKVRAASRYQRDDDAITIVNSEGELIGSTSDRDPINHGTLIGSARWDVALG